jgi:hypothetical protein
MGTLLLIKEKFRSLKILRIFYPGAFNVTFAFVAGLLGLYYTARTPECFVKCGWPIQFVTQIPYDSVSVRFAVNYGALVVVWLFWYVVGCFALYGFQRLWLYLKSRAVKGSGVAKI